MSIILQPSVFFFFPDVEKVPLADVPCFLNEVFDDVTVMPFTGDTEEFPAGNAPVHGGGYDRIIAVARSEDDRMELRSILSDGRSFNLSKRSSQHPSIKIAVSFQPLSYLNKGRLIDGVPRDGMVVAFRNLVSSIGIAFIQSDGFIQFAKKCGLVVIVSSDADDDDDANGNGCTGYAKTVFLPQAPEDMQSPSVNDALNPVFVAVERCADQLIEDAKEISFFASLAQPDTN